MCVRYSALIGVNKGSPSQETALGEPMCLSGKVLRAGKQKDLNEECVCVGAGGPIGTEVGCVWGGGGGLAVYVTLTTIL